MPCILRLRMARIGLAMSVVQSVAMMPFQDGRS